MLIKFLFPKLHIYLNKKQYDAALKEAKKLAIEKEFLEVWKINCNINGDSFEGQERNQARIALYHAKQLANAKNTNKKQLD